LSYFDGIEFSTDQEIHSEEKSAMDSEDERFLVQPVNTNGIFVYLEYL
jgi:hypothetical protein